ncbi:hypothetical protein D3C86_1373820 [compost metagenome]
MVGEQRAHATGNDHRGNQVTGQQAAHGGYDDAMPQACGYRVGPIGSGRDHEQHGHRPESNKDTEGHSVPRVCTSFTQLFIIPALKSTPPFNEEYGWLMVGGRLMKYC